MIEEALVPMRSMMTDSPPEVQFVGYGSAVITSRVKYCAPRHDRELPCRIEISARVASGFRESGIRLTRDPVILHSPSGPT